MGWSTYLNVNITVWIECAIDAMQGDIDVWHRVQQAHQSAGRIHCDHCRGDLRLPVVSVFPVTGSDCLEEVLPRAFAKWAWRVRGPAAIQTFMMPNRGWTVRWKKIWQPLFILYNSCKMLIEHWHTHNGLRHASSDVRLIGYFCSPVLSALPCTLFFNILIYAHIYMWHTPHSHGPVPHVQFTRICTVYSIW